MSLENIQGGKSPEQDNQSSFKTTGALQIGESNYLIKQNNQGNMRLRPINVTLNKSMYLQEISPLPSECVTTFQNLDSNLTTIAYTGIKTPSIRWLEKTTGIDEPTITIDTTEAKSGKLTPVELYRKDLVDLFLRQGGKDKDANFFILPTTQQELVGIALKRQSSSMLFITPGNEALDINAQEGLLTFIDNVYKRLSERLNSLQIKTDDRIYQAFLPTGEIQFQYDTSTPTKTRQREIQKRIYQIQALLLTLDAEEKGTGENDPQLLAHVPFLHQNPEKENPSGIMSIFTRPAQQQQSRTRIILANSIWTNLLAKPESKLLIDPNKPQTHNIARPIAPPEEKLTVEPIAPPTQTAKQPQLTSEAPPRKLSEKQQAMTLARELNISLEETPLLFKDSTIANIGREQISTLNTQCDTLLQAAKTYMEQRHRGRPPENPAVCIIKPVPGSINVAGIKDTDAYEFLTGKIENDYKTKIETAFNAWEAYVQTIYRETNSRTERKLSKLKTDPALHAKIPDLATKLIPQLEAMLNKDQQTTTNNDVNVIELTQILLTTQICYALEEQYRQLKEKGQPVEIDNWANYCNATLTRIKTLLNDRSK